MFELLVSISIIGILMAVAMVSYSSAQKKARDSRRVQDINNIQKAAEQRYASSTDYSYPQSTDKTAWQSADGTQILEQFPKDPKNVDYYTNLNAASYCVCAQMEVVTAGNSAINCGFGTATTYYCVKNQQ